MISQGQLALVITSSPCVSMYMLVAAYFQSTTDSHLYLAPVHGIQWTRRQELPTRRGPRQNNRTHGKFGIFSHLRLIFGVIRQKQKNCGAKAGSWPYAATVAHVKETPLFPLLLTNDSQCDKTTTLYQGLEPTMEEERRKTLIAWNQFSCGNTPPRLGNCEKG